jgi:hypothetical protein
MRDAPSASGYSCFDALSTNGFQAPFALSRSKGERFKRRHCGWKLIALMSFPYFS